MSDAEKLIWNIAVIVIAWVLAAAIYTHWLRKSALIQRTVGL